MYEWGFWGCGLRVTGCEGFFVKVYKYMHIYLWTALRISDFRIRDLCFLNERFEVEVGLSRGL